MAASSQRAKSRELLTELLRPAAADGPVEEWAELLLREFGSLRSVLVAPIPDLARIFGGEARAVAHLITVQKTVLHALEVEALSGPIISSSTALIEYLRTSMSDPRRERFRVMYLNCNNRLLLDDVYEGTIDQAPAYPREVVRRGLAVGATALLLVHNHPSGDPTPSKLDVATTAKIARAAKLFDIEIHDHLVLGNDRCISMRDLGML